MKRPCTLDEARAAKGLAVEAFGRLAAVASVGITRIRGGYGLKVNLSEAPSPTAALPSEIAGIPVRVEVVSKIRKQID